MTIRQVWKSGDIFLVPNSDGNFTPGQVIAHEKRTLHCASCAFFDQRVNSIDEGEKLILHESKCFAALLATPDSLDEKRWPIVGWQAVALAKKSWPYEEQLSRGKKNGPLVRGSGNVTSFLDAFYALRPWDGWYRPDYLDEYLLSPYKKPKNLILVKSQ